MRLLRRYVAIIHAYCSRLVINDHEFTLTNNAYLYMHGILVFMHFADQFEYTLYRKLHHVYKMGRILPLRLIHFAYPYAILFSDDGECRCRIKIGENGKVLVEKYYRIPFKQSGN